MAARKGLGGVLGADEYTLSSVLLIQEMSLKSLYLVRGSISESMA
jgi:hypothetical protein